MGFILRHRILSEVSQTTVSADSACRAIEMYGSGSNVILNAYERWISPIDGGNTCPMSPSCSQYAKILFDREPFPVAVAGMCDRLLRCSRDL
jgi:putative component of membrane protein insertase Oxa1/YidC/SpoIIIJ protein YidD